MENDMNITLYEMSKNDRELARHLAPEEELAKLALAKHKGLLAIDQDAMVPAGIMICSFARANRLDIEWLFVHEDFRNNEIATELLIAAYDMAMATRIPYVGVRMAGELAAEENVAYAEGFFASHGFFGGTYTEGDWVISAEELRASVLSGGKYRQKNVHPVSLASRAELRTFLQKHWKALAQSPLYDYESALADMDADLSMVYVDGDGQIDGVLLVQRVDHLVYPLAIHMCHVSEKVFLGLAAGVLEAAKQIRGDLTYHIVYSKRAATLLMKIFKKMVATPAYQMIAPADHYELEKEAMANGMSENIRYRDLMKQEMPDQYTFEGMIVNGKQYY